MPTREHMTTTHDYARVSLCPSRRKAKGQRGKRTEITNDSQKKLNQRNRENKLSDLLNLNFTKNDLHMRLSYTIEPKTVLIAMQIFYNFMRRLRYFRKKQGLPELKIIFILEEGERSGRLHHHIFVQGDISWRVIEEIWGQGSTSSYPMKFGEKGLMGLAIYGAKGKKTELKKETRENHIQRAWNSSHNLKRPQQGKEIRQNDYRVKASDLAYIDENPDDIRFIEDLYPGWCVAEVQTTPHDLYTTEEKSPVPRAHFVTIYLYRKDADFLKPERQRGGTRCKKTE